MQFGVYKALLDVTAASVHWRHSPGKHGQALAPAAHPHPDEGLGDDDGVEGETQNQKTDDFEIFRPEKGICAA